jgi:hypothetical protein
MAFDTVNRLGSMVIRDDVNLIPFILYTFVSMSILDVLFHASVCP